MARLSNNINNAVAGVTEPDADDVLDLGARLFWDPRGPIALYPHLPRESARPEPMVSWSGIVDDPDHPARLVHKLESTQAGCDWMMGRWAELRSLVEQGRSWQSPDKLKAIRLLGRQPLDVFDDPDVAIVFAACYKIDSSGGELLHEVWNELKFSEVKIAKERLTSRPIDGFLPRSRDEARKALLDVVDRAAYRLGTRIDKYRKQTEANAGLMPNLLAFDGSVEGERLRRYEASCSRTLIRTLAEFDKMHNASDETVPVLPANGNGVSPVTIIDVEPDFETDSFVPGSLCTQSIDASAPIAYNEISQPAEAVNLSMPSSPERATIHQSQKLPNEPTDSINQDLRNEPIAATVQKLPNEPTDSINQDLRNEPIAATVQKLPNEPTDSINQDLRNEPIAATVQKLPNEPTDSINQDLRNEPITATKLKLPNEPIDLINQELPTEPTDLTVQNAEPEEAINGIPCGIQDGFAHPAILRSENDRPQATSRSDSFEQETSAVFAASRGPPAISKRLYWERSGLLAASQPEMMEEELRGSNESRRTSQSALDRKPRT